MGRHIVGAFAIVDERGIAIGHQAAREMLEIAAHGRVGVFADDQRCARVMDEQMTEPLDQPGSLDDLLDLTSDLDSSTAACLDRQNLPVHAVQPRGGLISETESLSANRT